jgi:PHP domain
MEVLAACHVHSKWSYDGSWALEELSAKFRSRGYRVLMMTEHDRGFSASRLRQYREACAAASTNEILIVPGIEYSDAANRVHVLVWGDVPFLGEELPTSEMLKAAKAADGVAVLAHPSRKSAWQCFEPGWAEHLLGIEVWNRKYDGWAPSETAPPLLPAANAIPFVGLDFHTQRQFFPLGMALDMGPEISETAVLSCMRARRCHTRAFGAPLTQNLFRTALPALKMAERSRRTAARIVRQTGLLSR